MDKADFDNEIFSRLPRFELPLHYDSWCQNRRKIMTQINPITPAIDYHLVQAVFPFESKLSDLPVEKIAPGFRERLREYVQLQQQLLHDLTKINKEVTKDALPFREWLQYL